MKITRYCIDGLHLVEAEPFVDLRGRFARVFCQREFEAAGLSTNWVQISASLNTIAGTLRGFHFQTGRAVEAKLVRCIRGKAHDVALDLRNGSATFGQHAAISLDSELLNALYIPPGFAHGFQTLVDNTELQYFNSEFYSPESEGGVDALDSELAVKWPLPVSIRSDRDSQLPPSRTWYRLDNCVPTLRQSTQSRFLESWFCSAF